MRLRARPPPRGTELNWTILGPTTLTLDEPTGKISLGSTVGRDAERGTVSRGNVARTIVASLKYDGTIGKSLPYSDGDDLIENAFARL